MDTLKLVFIIFEEGIQPDVLEALQRHGLTHYTLWEGASGVGETGPKRGDPVWPGLNGMLMVAMAEKAVQPLIADLHAFRDSLPIRPGLRFIITDAVLV